MTGRFLTAEWRHLVMLNYPIDPARLSPYVPPGVELDTFDNVAYVSMVGFLFQKARLLRLPMPGHRNFEEVNLRFYVRRELPGEVRRGVTFIKELVPRLAIAKVARWAYNENYEATPMRHELDLQSKDAVSRFRYEWRNGTRWDSLQATVRGPSQPLVDGSLEQFIAEHYWGYCAQRRGASVEYRVEHPSWNVWHAETASLDCDAEHLYGAEFADVLGHEPASAFVADGSAVTVRKPTRMR